MALLRRRAARVARAVIADPDPHTVVDPEGAVRSVQAAELALPAPALERLWSPGPLGRLAGTYWRYLSRVTLGLIRVLHGPRERAVVLLGRPLVLLRFLPPECELSPEGGRVRWPIADGLLVAPRGRGGGGYLEMDVRRHPEGRPGEGRVRVQITVAGYHPAVARWLGSWLYAQTQARIHVLVTHGFLRSLARAGSGGPGGARSTGP